MALRLHKLLTTALTGAASLCLATVASAADYAVDINKTQILHLPGAAAAVVIGNPDIADVSVHSIDTLFLVGRAYGETNLLVLDERGQTMMNANITVGKSVSANGVQIHRLGEGRESYSCNPYCLPAPVMGDRAEFRESFQSEGMPITNTTATGTPSGGAQFAPPPMAFANGEQFQPGKAF